jgi:hypothetical protein
VLPSDEAFDRSIKQQLVTNAARTPTERMQALCDLLDAVRAMAPQDERSKERRKLAMRVRQREREEWHAECRRLFAAQRAKDSTTV